MVERRRQTLTKSVSYYFEESYIVIKYSYSIKYYINNLITLILSHKQVGAYMFSHAQEERVFCEKTLVKIS